MLEFVQVLNLSQLYLILPDLLHLRRLRRICSAYYEGDAADQGKESGRRFRSVDKRLNSPSAGQLPKSGQIPIAWRLLDVRDQAKRAASSYPQPLDIP